MPVIITPEEIARLEREGTAAQENRDPWEHRAAKMKCFSCMWFVPKKAQTPTQLGRCRRHAPTMSGYPVVFDSDWCGDHKLDENKA